MKHSSSRHLFTTHGRKHTDSSLFKRLIIALAKIVVKTRYRVTVTGYEQIKAKGTDKVLFLANHPALIDPVLLFLMLYNDFKPRTIGDEYQIHRPVIAPVAKMFGVVTIPNFERGNIEDTEKTLQAFSAVADEVNEGDNLLLYPSGHLKRSYLERIGASSATHVFLNTVPGLRVVLVRQNGLWGSRFSHGFNGKPPVLLDVVKSSFKYVLASFLFFMPKRTVEYEFIETDEFPYHGSKMEVNKWLEDFFNENAAPNTYVPYLWWQKKDIRQLPEPVGFKIEGDSSKVPSATRSIVEEKLKELSGVEELSDQDKLNYDLGLDSLTVVDLIHWIEEEFGFSVGTPDSLACVGDVMLAAVGKAVSAEEKELNPLLPAWFDTAQKQCFLPDEKTIPGCFVSHLLKTPRKMLFADELSGTKTYQDMAISLFVLVPIIKALEEKYVGIMMPASVVVNSLMLSVQFAGCIPVMVNWTVGERNMKHSLELAGVKHVLTSKKLLSRLKSRGINFDVFEDRFIFLEDIAAQVGVFKKLSALVRAKFFPGSLRLPAISQDETAVVLFTSGSESLPKAVPLSHKNILTNIRDILTVHPFDRKDTIIGFLPPFHSFGIVGSCFLPMTAAFKAVFHANPTDSSIIAKMIAHYKVSIVIGTPTFLSGILKVATREQLRTLELAVTGAEKATDATFALLDEKCPHLQLVEGYGITECSPVVSANRPTNVVPSSIGTPMPSVECMLVNPETGEKQKNIGMLLVRGDSIFSGYLKYEGPNPFVEIDGKQWYKTGDIVSIDKDGIFFFVGRLKRFVKLGGEMISLPAVEAVLLPHFESLDGPCIAVEADADADNPEIVLFATIDVTRQEANRIIKEAGLSALHNIRRVLRVNEIPVLGTGKTDYRMLREMLVEKH